jgi:hypothetical protein
VLALSILISTPFIVISELKIMFLKPGAYDHIAFCAEDLSQWGQVCIRFFFFSFFKGGTPANIYSFLK